MTDIEEAVAKMEPVVSKLGFLGSIGEASEVSIAISLKRIADAIAPENGQDIGLTFYYIEQSIRNLGRY